MNGMELARAYYEAFGREMLHRDFPEIESTVAVGLCGSGSECFGFDDDISRDHDFEPGFCLFLPGEEVIDRRTAFRLERAYAHLPAQFQGFSRARLSPVGGSRHGVIRQSDFWQKYTGTPNGALSPDAWLNIPSYALAEATNGRLFRDDSGVFTARRIALRSMPEDARLHRLARELLTMAQAGQYNLPRMLRRGDHDAAHLCTFEFVRAALQSLFLLNSEYMPFYKWAFRAARALPRLSGLTESLSRLLQLPCSPQTAEEKCTLAEDVAAGIISELQAQDLTRADCGDLEKHARSVANGIEDVDIRNRGI